MLKNETAKKLYHDYAEKMPIIDYHYHISQKIIAENYNFKSVYDLFLNGDHYKWRLIRTAGLDEDLITDGADNFEKWKTFADCVPLMIGNQMYHCAHLEVKRYFDIDTLLSAGITKEVWDKVTSCLEKDEYHVRGLIAMFGVDTI